MKTAYSLFSQAVLTQDIPNHQLKRGDIATIVEFYPMPEGEEDGYSLKGFNIPQITLEVAVSQIMPLEQWQEQQQRKQALLLKAPPTAETP